MICPYTTFEHGADRDILLGQVRACVLHRTGNFGWTGNRAAGLNRLHSTPGTFHFLIGREEGQASQFYPANCYTTHAADANWSGDGVEFEGPPGEPLTAFQLAKGGEVIRWLAKVFNLPLQYHDAEFIRIDNGAYRGFVSHRAVLTAPEWRHSDYIEAAEFDIMAGVPKSPTGEDDMFIVQTETGRLVLFTGTRAYDIDDATRNAHVAQGIPNYLGFDEAWVAAEQARLANPPGLSEAQTRAIVAEEVKALLNATAIKPGTIRVKTLSVS